MSEVSCSFCARGNDDVELMLAVPPSFICNECVDVCVSVIAEQRQAKSSAAFTPAQEARLREIVREEAGRTAETVRRVARDGENLIVHTPLGGGRPRKFKGVFDPKPPSAPQGNA